MTDPAAALSVPCPHCGATRGHPCLVGGQQAGKIPIQLTAPTSGQPVQHAARWQSLPQRPLAKGV